MKLNKKGCFDSRINAFATLMNTNKREMFWITDIYPGIMG